MKMRPESTDGVGGTINAEHRRRTERAGAAALDREPPPEPWSERSASFLRLRVRSSAGAVVQGLPMVATRRDGRRSELDRSRGLVVVLDRQRADSLEGRPRRCARPGRGLVVAPFSAR